MTYFVMLVLDFQCTEPEPQHSLETGHRKLCMNWSSLKAAAIIYAGNERNCWSTNVALSVICLEPIPKQAMPNVVIKSGQNQGLTVESISLAFLQHFCKSISLLCFFCYHSSNAFILYTCLENILHSS